MNLVKNKSAIKRSPTHNNDIGLLEYFITIVVLLVTSAAHTVTQRIKISESWNVRYVFPLIIIFLIIMVQAVLCLFIYTLHLFKVKYMC